MKPEGSFPVSEIINCSYDKLWKMFIQPNRTQFEKEKLGSARFRIEPNFIFQREDGTVEGAKHQKLEYTFYRLEKNLLQSNDFQTNDCCLVYLHSHSSQRLEGVHLLPFCASVGMDFCTFDMPAHGYSGGEYTTLGVWESEDLKILLDHLKQTQQTKKFVLWGRSMGAVTALIYASRHASNSLAYVVMDSPFSSVEQMLKDIGDSYTGFGGFMMPFLYDIINEDIESRIGFNLRSLKPIDYCKHIQTPCAFMIANEDTMVTVERTQEMFDAVSCNRKDLIVFEGTHSTPRPQHIIQKLIHKIKLHCMEPAGSGFQSYFDKSHDYTSTFETKSRVALPNNKENPFHDKSPYEVTANAGPNFSYADYPQESPRVPKQKLWPTKTSLRKEPDHTSHNHVRNSISDWKGFGEEPSIILGSNNQQTMLLDSLIFPFDDHPTKNTQIEKPKTERKRMKIFDDNDDHNPPTLTNRLKFN